MSLTLALYKAPGRIDDRLVRWATRSPYSHVELTEDRTLSAGCTRTAQAVSASRRDGGVRIKAVTFEAGAWDFLPVGGWAPVEAFDRAAVFAGDGYDWAGILGVFCLPLRRHAAGRWTCSEIVGHALGLAQPHLLAPGDLADRVEDMNAAWRAGWSKGIRG